MESSENTLVIHDPFGLANLRIDDDFCSEDELEEQIIRNDSEDYFNNQGADNSYSTSMVKRPCVTNSGSFQSEMPINRFFQIESQRAIDECEESKNERELNQEMNDQKSSENQLWGVSDLTNQETYGDSDGDMNTLSIRSRQISIETDEED